IRLPGTPRQATLVLQSGSTSRTVPLERDSAGWFSALVPNVPTGRLTARVDAGGNTFAATVQIGAASSVPGIPAQPLPTGPTAPAEADDLAVAVQRTGNRQAMVTVLTQTGAALRDGLIATPFGIAVPCTNTVNVCFEIPVPAKQTRLDVRVDRVGRPSGNA